MHLTLHNTGITSIVGMPHRRHKTTPWTLCLTGNLLIRHTTRLIDSSAYTTYRPTFDFCEAPSQAFGLPVVICRYCCSVKLKPARRQGGVDKISGTRTLTSQMDFTSARTCQASPRDIRRFFFSLLILVRFFFPPPFDTRRFFFFSPPLVPFVSFSHRI